MHHPREEKVLGVIGGLGPQATADFFNRVIRHTPTQVDQDHLHILIDNNPKAPNRNHAIAGTGPSPASSFTESALRLKAAGAELLVMPCNTAHAFKDAIVDAVEIPFISIIEETVNYIDWQFSEISRAGLLAVDGCLQAGLYHEALLKKNIEPICLNSRDQAEFMKLVYTIKASGVNPQVMEEMKGLADKLIAQHAQLIIAGCTEVPLVLKQDDLSVPLVDSTEILARQCVVYALNETE